jgi:hypothetical protein
MTKDRNSGSTILGAVTDSEPRPWTLRFTEPSADPTDNGASVVS